MDSVDRILADAVARMNASEKDSEKDKTQLLLIDWGEGVEVLEEIGIVPHLSSNTKLQTALRMVKPEEAIIEFLMGSLAGFMFKGSVELERTDDIIGESEIHEGATYVRADQIIRLMVLND